MAAYPGAVPSLTRPATGDPGNDGSATDATVVVDALSDEVEAIATELGTDPAGASATVKARLDTLDSTVGGKEAAGTAASAVSAHEGAADPHAGYALESSLGGAAVLNVGTTTGTVAAGDDSRLSDARTPTAHKSSHATGGSDALAAADIGAAASSHTHAQSDVTNLATDLSGKIAASIVDQKGDLIVATAADTVARVAVGTNDYVLTADDTQAAGMKWAAASGGGGYATIQDEGSALTARATLNLIGPTVAAADNSGSSRTDVTLTPGYRLTAASSDPTTHYGDSGYVVYSGGAYDSSSGSGKGSRLVTVSGANVRIAEVESAYCATSGSGRCGVAIASSGGGSFVTAAIESDGKVYVRFVYLWSTDYALYYTSTLSVGPDAPVAIALSQVGASWIMSCNDGTNYETATGPLDAIIAANNRVGVYFKNYTGYGIQGFAYGGS